MTTTRKLTLSEAARELGIHPETLRNWEKYGKLVAERDAYNYRIYDPATIARLKREREKKGE